MNTIIWSIQSMPKTTSLSLTDADREALDRIQAAYGMPTMSQAWHLAIRLLDEERTTPEQLDRLLTALKIDEDDRALILIQALGRAGRAYVESLDWHVKITGE
jgi:hypothetical protein